MKGSVSASVLVIYQLVKILKLKISTVSQQLVTIKLGCPKAVEADQESQHNG